MSTEPLTLEEIGKLRALLPVADQLRQEAEYHLAWRLVLARWKAIVIWVATLVAAVVIILEFGKKWLFGVAP